MSLVVFVRGDAEMAVQPVSELLSVPGVDFVGTIPEAIQKINVYAAAIVNGSKETDASRRLIAFHTADTAAAAIRKHGMEPAITGRSGRSGRKIILLTSLTSL